MNGARSTFMRKGYLLTALAAAVLLAASSGTAWAQITVTGPATVTEGNSATYALTARASIPVGASSTTVTVELELSAGTAEAGITAAESGDYNQNLGASATFTFPANPATATSPLTSTQTASLVVQTSNDPDAEDEIVETEFDISSAGVGPLLNAAASGRALAITATGPSAAPTSLKIDDDETQAYVLAVTSPVAPAKPTEGTPVLVSLSARPAHDNGGLTLTLNLDRPAPAYTLAIADDGDDDNNAANQATIGTGGTPSASITITPAADGNRDPDTVTLSAYSGNAARSVLEASLAIKLEDANKLPAIGAVVTDKDGKVLTPQPTSVTEGESIHVVVMVVDEDGDVIASGAEEDLTVVLTPSGTADAADYTGARSIPITDGTTTSAAVKLDVREDEDVGMEMLVLDAEVSGEAVNGAGTSPSPGVLSLEIVDATTKQVAPMDQDDLDAAIEAAMSAGGGDEGLNPGEMFEVMASDLFDVTTGYAANYAVAVSGGAIRASVSGGTITVNAEDVGEATVTVTATAEAASSARPSQSVSNIAKVAFDVTVVDRAIVVTVAADPTEIEEGGTSTITATASREVKANDGAVTIALDVVGDATLDAESITIPAGSNSGSAMLTATEDDDDYENETVTVIATGSGITGTMRVDIAVNDNDEAPAPPVAEPTVTAKDDAAGMIATAIATAAGDSAWMVGGTAAMVDMSDLFDAADDVVVNYSATSSDEDVVSASVTRGTMLALTPAGAGTATITVTGSDAAGGGVATVTHDAMVVLPTLGVTLTAAPLEIDEGGMSTITATANREVDADDGTVTIALEVVGDATLDAESITIPAGSSSGSVMLTATEDDDDYTDETVTVIASGSGIAGNMRVEIAVNDNDEAPAPPVAEPTVTAKDDADGMIAAAIATAAGDSDWMVGGTAAMVDMSDLFDAADDVVVNYSAGSSNEDVVTTSVTRGTMLALTPAGAGTATITVTGSDAAGGGVATVTHDAMVVLIDLVVTLEMPDGVMGGNLVEGQSYDIKVMANRAVTEDTEVMILMDRTMSDADTSDYEVDSAMIMAGDDMATVALMVTEDDTADAGHDAGETLVLFGRYGDREDTNSLTFTLWDEAVPALPLIGQLLLALFLMAGGARLYRRRRG